jgi:hypothetical protein
MSSTPYLPVKNKRDFVRRYQQGEFGNCAPTWNVLNDFLASGYRGLVHLRNRVAGGYTLYDVPADDVWHKSLEITQQGLVAPQNLYYSGMAPTDKTLIQGEVMEREGCGLYLYYSKVAKPMRAALIEKSQEASGIIAVSLLRYYLCQNSYEWLQTLLERYPFHVIEFSTYSEQWGTLAPRFNTVFWEVRNY